MIKAAASPSPKPVAEAGSEATLELSGAAAKAN